MSFWKRKIKPLLKSPRAAAGYEINGENNKIIIVEEDGTEHPLNNKRINGLRLTINGDNNVLKFSSQTNFINAMIEINSSDNFVEIEKIQSIIGCISIWNGNHQNFIWHSGMGSFRFARFYLCQEGSSIEIGNGCLLSDVTVWTSDAHPLIDANTAKNLNKKPAHILIGKNSWLSTECMLLKNASIPEGTVVGARSLVTKHFTEMYTVLAGNPAKVIKRNIVWNEDSLQAYNTAGGG